jgi:hypothetical protein
VRRLFGASAEALIIVSLVFGLLALPVLAARGGNGGGGGKPVGGGSLSLVLTADANADSLPNHLDSITFNIEQAATDVPMVGLRCWQASSFVHDGYIALYDASWLAKYFTLSSSYWDPALDATCTARLFYYDRRGGEKLLATTTFGVAP